MGWTTTHRPYGKTNKEFFTDLFNYDKPEEKRSGTVLRYWGTYTTAYMAYEIKYPNKETGAIEREVVALVVLIRNYPNAQDGYDLGYKEMDESCGPCERECPKTILEMLTPTTHEYAIGWRKDCWDRIKQRESKPKVRQGDWVKFNHVMKFTNGAEADTFQWRNGGTFCTQYGDRVRIRKWREMDYQVLGQRRVLKGELVAP